MLIPIIMLIVGIVGLVKGRISVTGTKEIRRPASIFISLLFMAPLPLSIIATVVLSAMAVAKANGGQPNLQELESTANILSAVIFFGCLILALVLSFALAKPKEMVRKSVDQDDYDDAPRKKREYDDEDDRPRRRPSRNDD